MDNASKALIMAGAILLAVAIVGLGMFLFGQATGVVDLSVGQIDALGVSGINSKLVQFEGRDVKGSEIRELRNWIEAVNTRDAMPADITITYSAPATAANITNITRYRVACTKDATSGYVSTVTISVAP